MKRLVEQEAAAAAEVERKLSQVERRLEREKSEAAAEWVAEALQKEKMIFAEKQKEEMEKVEKIFEETKIEKILQCYAGEILIFLTTNVFFFLGNFLYI